MCERFKQRQMKVRQKDHPQRDLEGFFKTDGKQCTKLCRLIRAEPFASGGVRCERQLPTFSCRGHLIHYLI